MTDGWVSVDPAEARLTEAVHKRNVREGEERLLLAILENAVEYFQNYELARKPSGKKLFQETEEWFLEKNSDRFFSFEDICETLQLHPDHIRRGLRVWKEARLERILLRVLVKRPNVR